jgi:HSP20 family protein
MARGEPQFGRSGGPFALTRQLFDDMDRMMASVFGRDPFARDFFGSMLTPWQQRSGGAQWWPQIEVAQRGNKLEVHADVPGLKKDDVKVEVEAGELRISGERRSESERSEQGMYRSERSYGTFQRTIPLPEGANLDSTSATFENGVLKIEIDVPQSEPRSARQIEVREAGEDSTRH